MILKFSVRVCLSKLKMYMSLQERVYWMFYFISIRDKTNLQYINRYKLHFEVELGLTYASLTIYVILLIFYELKPWTQHRTLYGEGVERRLCPNKHASREFLSFLDMAIEVLRGHSQ